MDGKEKVQTITAIFPKGKDLYLTFRRNDGSTYNLLYQNFKPYFYGTNSELGPIAPKNHPDLVKVFAEHPGQVPQLREQFKYSYEANVVYDARFLIDKGDKIINPNVQWNVTWFDIEAKVNGHTIDEIKNGATEITVITKLDSLFKRVRCFTWVDYNEEQLQRYLKWTFNLAIVKSVLHSFNEDEYSIKDVKLETDEDIIKFIQQHSNLEKSKIKEEVQHAKERLKPIFDLDIKVIKCENEKEMLKAFAKDLIEFQPDVLTGWNVYFDYVTLYNRMKHYKLLKMLCPSFIGQFDGKTYTPSPRVDEVTLQNGKVKYNFHTPGYYVVDYLEVYQKRRFKVEKSYTLDYITRVWNLEIPKFRHGYSNLDQLLQEQPTLYIYYNIIDVITLYLLEQKTNYMDITISVSNYTKCPMTYCTSQRMLVDCALIDYINKRGFVRITRGHKLDVNYEGAYVYAERGFHKGWITDADFTSLYPSIIRTCNISPETFVGTLDKLGLTKEEALKQFIVCPNTACFKKKTEQHGILPILLDELFNKRKQAKKQAKEYLNKFKETGDQQYFQLYKQYDNLQFTLKILLNSFYGVFGDAGYDLCIPEIAGAITATGRFLIKFAKEKLEEKGFKVVYIDTDSNYIKLKQPKGNTIEEQICDCVGQIIDIYNYINSQWDELVKKEFGVNTEHYLEMKSELLAKNMIISTKKRYAIALLLSEAQLDVLKSLYPNKEKMLDFLRSIQLKPEIEVKGLEVVRSDVSDALVSEMYQMLEDLLLERKSPSEIRQNLKYLFIRLRRLAAKDLNKIAIPVRLNSWVDKNGNPIRNSKALAIKEYNKQHPDNPIMLGEKCLMVYTKDVAGAKVWKIGEEPPKHILHLIDWKKMYKALVEKKLKIWWELLSV